MENIFALKEVLGWPVGRSFLFGNQIDKILGPEVWRGEEKGYLKPGQVVGVVVERHYDTGDVKIIKHATHRQIESNLKDVTNYVTVFGFNPIAASEWWWDCQYRRWQLDEGKF